MLAVDGLTKRYGRKAVVDSLSFSVTAGSILGLVGPNGAGKTTTLSCLAGLLMPDHGTASWNGTALLSRPNVLGMLPESPEVYPLLSVWEHLEFVARLFRLPGDWRVSAEEWLERLNLSPHRDKLGAVLSKGLRQRLALAGMGLRGARVVLVDEPMIGLDPKGQREVRDILMDLKGRGSAIVLSSHQLDLIEQVADDVLILHEGRAVAHDTVAGLKSEARQGDSLEDILLMLTDGTRL